MALHDLLTDRQWKVYRLIFEGKKYREIGLILGYAESTIDGYAQRIFNNLGVNSRAEATHYAFEHRLFQ